MRCQERTAVRNFLNIPLRLTWCGLATCSAKERSGESHSSRKKRRPDTQRNSLTPIPLEHERTLSQSRHSSALGTFLTTRTSSCHGELHRPGVLMSDAQETHSAHRPELVVPLCATCRAPMVLVRLDPGRYGSYRGKYVCEPCGRTFIDDVRLTRLDGPDTELQT